MQGGGKRVPWGAVGKHNDEYIEEPFLLPNYPLTNPNRIAEATLTMYWKHLYSLCEEGQQFKFKAAVVGNADEGEEEDDSRNKDGDENDNIEKDGDENGSMEKDGDENDSMEKDGDENDSMEKDGDEGGSGPEGEGGPRNIARSKEGEKDTSGRKDLSEEMDQNQDLAHRTPAQCHSDEEKIAFLRSLCLETEDYQAVVDLISQMEVSSQHRSHASN